MGHQRRPMLGQDLTVPSSLNDIREGSCFARKMLMVDPTQLACSTS